MLPFPIGAHASTKVVLGYGVLYMDWGNMNAPFGEVNIIQTVRSLETERRAGPSMDSGADRINLDGNHHTTAKAKPGKNFREAEMRLPFR